MLTKQVDHQYAGLGQYLTANLIKVQAVMDRATCLGIVQIDLQNLAACLRLLLQPRLCVTTKEFKSFMADGKMKKNPARFESLAG